jgi:hypothetical protein
VNRGRGKRLVWAERTCNTERIVSATLAALRARPRLRTLHCPLKLNQPIFASKRSLGVDYSCGGFQVGCYTDALYVLAARNYRLGTRRIPRGTELTKPRVSGGDRDNPTFVPLTRTRRRLFRARTGVRVKVVAAPFDSFPEGEFRQRRTVVTTAKALRPR